MSQDDVLFGYRLQLVDLAGRVGVTAACRTFGVHRSTYYAWKRKIEREGLGALRPRERRRPRMPNQLSPLLEQRIVAFAFGHPGLGPRRIAAELARPRWGGLVVSANGVWRCLCRHGLNTRGKRLSLGAGYAVRAAASGAVRATGRGGAARRAGRLRLLLRWPPAQPEGDGLAADRDRRLLLLHLGQPSQLQTRPTECGPDLEASPARGRGVARSRLATRAGTDR